VNYLAVLDKVGGYPKNNRISLVSFRNRKLKYPLILSLTDRSRLGTRCADEEINSEEGKEDFIISRLKVDATLRWPNAALQRLAHAT